MNCSQISFWFQFDLSLFVWLPPWLLRLFSGIRISGIDSAFIHSISIQLLNSQFRKLIINAMKLKLRMNWIGIRMPKSGNAVIMSIRLELNSWPLIKSNSNFSKINEFRLIAVNQSGIQFHYWNLSLNEWSQASLLPAMQSFHFRHQFFAFIKSNSILIQLTSVEWNWFV